jgi:hypothetical protein
MAWLALIADIAVAIAVFAVAGSYVSAAAFVEGFGPAIGLAAGLSAAGALAGLTLPGRRSTPILAVPVLEAQGQ